MERVDYDFSSSKNMINNMVDTFVADKDNGYDKIYPRTNEDLKKLFQCFSVKDKKVLTKVI